MRAAYLCTHDDSVTAGPGGLAPLPALGKESLVPMGLVVMSGKIFLRCSSHSAASVSSRRSRLLMNYYEEDGGFRFHN